MVCSSINIQSFNSLRNTVRRNRDKQLVMSIGGGGITAAYSNFVGLIMLLFALETNELGNKR